MKVLNTEQLMAAGYKPFKDSFDEYAKMAYQKRFDEGLHKLYFINVYHYDMGMFKKMGYRGPENTFECKLQFERKVKPDVVNISFAVTNMTLDELEEYVKMLYNVLEAEPYE